MATSPNFGWLEPDNTDLVKNGALAIRTAVDAIDTSMGDLLGGTTGQVLAKASNTDMDFVWAADAGAPESLGFAAGKNKIINGDFSINQRSFTSTTTDNSFGFDRWQAAFSGATATYSSEAFTPGAAPVAGYEGSNFARLAVTVGNDNCRLQQKIEDVRTFAGQTVTLSFWAKGTNPTTEGNLTASLVQAFGSGGSSPVTLSQTFVLTANWTRYSLTFAVGSLSGKTIGTSSALEVKLEQATSISTDAWTLDVWGVQLEAGSVATAFQTATGTLQGELAACQRYYWKQSASGVNNYFTAGGLVESSTSGWATLIPPVTMRVTPTSVDYSGLILSDSAGGGYAPSAVTVFANGSGTNTVRVSTTISGATGGRWAYLRANSTNDYIGLSAEL
jgi:hypothetical protein